MAKNKKFVYAFEEGNRDMKQILGGKGANLAEMKSLGINVPPGFTISTEACDLYYKDGKKINLEVKKQIEIKLKDLEKKELKKFLTNSDLLIWEGNNLKKQKIRDLFL